MLLFFFFNDTATTEIYTLSLHDALPIYRSRRWIGLAEGFRLGGRLGVPARRLVGRQACRAARRRGAPSDRKSTRLNSSHANISYAVFCLKKKKQKDKTH